MKLEEDWIAQNVTFNHVYDERLVSQFIEDGLGPVAERAFDFGVQYYLRDRGHMGT